MARGEQVFGHLAVTRRALELIDDIAVPSEAEPGKPVENGGNRRIGRALAVGVLDPQQHLAARVVRIEPVEQRRAGAADMQKTRRRRREAGDHRVWHGA